MEEVTAVFPTCDMIRCADSDEWREERRKGVGGSDVAAILGISAYSSPYRVWLDKVYGIHDDISGKPAVEWGNILEPVVADHYAEMHPDVNVVEPDFMLRSKDRPWAQASLDRYVLDPKRGMGVLEIKTAGARRSSDWDDGVPVYYLTQVMHYLSVTGCRYADVAVLIGGQDYREYTVEWDDADASTVIRAVDSFWHDYVETGIPPAVGELDSGAVFSAHSKPSGEFIESDNMPSAVAKYLLAKSERDSADKKLKLYGAQLREVIGDAPGITCPDGKLTWRRYEKSRFDAKSFDEDHPGEREAYMTSSRVDGGLVWRPAKKEV